MFPSDFLVPISFHLNRAVFVSFCCVFGFYISKIHIYFFSFFCKIFISQWLFHDVDIALFIFHIDIHGSLLFLREVIVILRLRAHILCVVHCVNR